jgi:PIN domain nuclease of toxin-antitoxin system
VSRLLLDSHVVLWWLDQDWPLPPKTRAAIEDVENEVAVSAASIWELHMKRATGRVEWPGNLLNELGAREVDLLAVNAQHAELAAELPMHHRDPFDRMLVAQALHEGYTLVTADRRLGAYYVPILAAA